MWNVEGNEWNNPFRWWKGNAVNFPILSQLAKRILCIPATSAPSERVFLIAGLAIANNRARLHRDAAAAQNFFERGNSNCKAFRDQKKKERLWRNTLIFSKKKFKINIKTIKKMQKKNLWLEIS